MQKIFVLIVLLLSGCATVRPLTQSEIEDLNRSKEKSYNVSWAKLYDASIAMLESYDYVIDVNDKKNGIITTKQRIPNKDVTDKMNVNLEKQQKSINVKLQYDYKAQREGIAIDERQIKGIYDASFEKLDEILNTSGREIAYPYNAVWGALVQTFAEKGIAVNIMDKDSGVLSSKDIVFEDNMSFSQKDNFIADDEIKRISERPSVFMAVWKAGRYRYSIFLKPVNQNESSLKVVCEIEAFNNIDGWRKCKSKGVLEQEIFKLVEAKLK